MLNDVKFYHYYEIIGGERIMAPSANSYHNNIMGRLHTIVNSYCYQKKRGMFLLTISILNFLTAVFTDPV